MKVNVVFISSESTSTLDHGAGSLCSSTLGKLKGFACPTSESSVAHIKDPDKKSLENTEQHSEEHKLRELEEENVEEGGRYWVADSEQVFSPDGAIVKYGGTFLTQRYCVQYFRLD